MGQRKIYDGKGEPYIPTLPILPDEILNKIAVQESQDLSIMPDSAYETISQWGSKAHVVPFEGRTRALKSSFYGRWKNTKPTRQTDYKPYYNKEGKRRRVSEVRRKLSHLQIKD